MTPEERRAVRRIANRATPLWERMPAASGAFDPRRLARWREVLGSRELLDRRMRSAPGVIPESLLRSPGPARLPHWTQTLAQVLSARPPVPGDASTDVPFGDVLEPFVAHARRRFHAAAPSARTLLSPAADAALERELVEHLSLVASLALGRMFYEFRFKRAPLAAFEDIWTRQPSSAAIYAEFAAQLRGRRLIDAFTRYPVLGRLLAQATNQWVVTSARLCRRAAADWPRITRLVNHPRCSSDGAITGISTGLSDRHAGGQTVAELTLATGARVIYKPRSVRPEIAYNAFLAWLNDQGLPLTLQTVRALERRTYGWMEAVAHRPCEDQAGVERFYTRAGMLLAVLHLLAVTDIHCENLIASGEHPVVVDLETLLSASVRRPVTVLDSGLLPRRPHAKESPVDASALGADETPDSDLRFPIWRSINTDQMTLSTGVPREQERHRVRLGERRPTVADHLSAFTHGFRAAYQCLQANRRRLAAHPVLDGFDGLQLRVLLRDSTTYGRLHLHLLHPEFLEDGLDRSIELEWLARPLCIRTTPSRGRLRVYEREIAAMEQLDLPHFDTAAWRAMGHDPSTDEARTFGGARDASLVRRRLAALSRAGCRAQLALIARSVRFKFGTARERRRRRSNATPSSSR